VEISSKLQEKFGLELQGKDDYLLYYQ